MSITITISCLFILLYALTSPFSIYSQGTASTTANNNGTGTANSIDSMTIDKSGNIYLADSSNHRIRNSMLLVTS